MPRQLEVAGYKLPVATEDELLEFANKLRQAGNASLLDSLLPSVKNDQRHCLIARNLNFDSVVVPELSVDGYADDSDVWAMAPALNHRLKRKDTQIADIKRANEQVRALAKAARLKTITVPETVYDKTVEIGVYPEIEIVDRIKIKLPKHIGNAAAAFDEGVAFGDLVASR